MTDTFILQLPEFDNKIYYIPQPKQYNILLSNDDNNSFDYNFDSYDSNDNISNEYITTTQQNNLFSNQNYFDESNLTDDLNFSFSPSYIQEIEYKKIQLLHILIITTLILTIATMHYNKG